MSVIADDQQVDAPAPSRRIDPLLSADFLAHLETQIASARRLLAIVFEQGTAIRQRDVQNVVRLAGGLQAEMHRREVLELERVELLQRAAAQLGVGPGDVSMSLLERLMDPGSAERAHASGAALRGMLTEIQREHRTNRALMQQELAFLDHLLRLAGATGGYDADGDHCSRRNSSRTRIRVFDLEA